MTRTAKARIMARAPTRKIGEMLCRLQAVKVDHAQHRALIAKAETRKSYRDYFGLGAKAQAALAHVTATAKAPRVRQWQGRAPDFTNLQMSAMPLP
jgi:hypothetical protein